MQVRPSAAAFEHALQGEDHRLPAYRGAVAGQMHRGRPAWRRRAVPAEADRADGFTALPPPGPAMPDTATARSARLWSSAPAAISPTVNR